MIVCSCLVWQWETWFLSVMFSCFPWPPGHLHSVLLGDPAPYPLQFMLAPTLTCSLHQQKEEKKAEKRVGFRGLKVCSPSHCLFPPPSPFPPSFLSLVYFLQNTAYLLFWGCFSFVLKFSWFQTLPKSSAPVVSVHHVRALEHMFDIFCLSRAILGCHGPWVWPRVNFFCAGRW